MADGSCKIFALILSVLVSESYRNIPWAKSGIPIHRKIGAQRCRTSSRSLALNRGPGFLFPADGHFPLLLIPIARAQCIFLRTSNSNVQNVSNHPESPPSTSLSSSAVNSAPERVVLSLLRLKPLSPGKGMPAIGFKAEYLFFNQPKEGEEWSMGDEWVMPWEKILSGESAEQAIQRTLNKVCTWQACTLP
jgi:hypothetical protein